VGGAAVCAARALRAAAEREERWRPATAILTIRSRSGERLKHRVVLWLFILSARTPESRLMTFGFITFEKCKMIGP
jgi:hypothetical protein